MENNSSLKNTSYYNDSNIGSNEDNKLRIISNLDFQMRNKTISDKSSPHLKSVYSRQAHLVSPNGVRQVYQQSSESSNKSVGQLSQQQYSDYSRRLVAQGLAITHSKNNDSNNTEHDLSAHTNLRDEEAVDDATSPSKKFRHLRQQIQNNQSSNYIAKIVPRNIINTATLANLKPVPKSFKSSMLPKDKNTTFTPQMSTLRRKIPRR